MKEAVQVVTHNVLLSLGCWLWNDDAASCFFYFVIVRSAHCQHSILMDVFSSVDCACIAEAHCLGGSVAGQCVCVCERDRLTKEL